MPTCAVSQRYIAIHRQRHLIRQMSEPNPSVGISHLPCPPRKGKLCTPLLPTDGLHTRARCPRPTETQQGTTAALPTRALHQPRRAHTQRLNTSVQCQLQTPRPHSRHATCVGCAASLCQSACSPARPPRTRGGLPRSRTHLSPDQPPGSAAPLLPHAAPGPTACPASHQWLLAVQCSTR